MAESANECTRIRRRAMAARAGRGIIFVSALAAQFCLSGCTHYFYLTADDFHHGRASDIQFQRDNSHCQTAATVRQNQVGGGDPRGVYNRAYAGCMKKFGHPPADIDLLGIGG